MDETDWRHAEGKAAGLGQAHLAISDDSGRIQSVAAAEDPNGTSVGGFRRKTAFFNTCDRSSACSTGKSADSRISFFSCTYF